MTEHEFQDQGALDQPEQEVDAPVEADPTVDPDNSTQSTLAAVNEAREAGEPLDGSPDAPVDGGQPSVTPDGTGVADAPLAGPDSV